MERLTKMPTKYPFTNKHGVVYTKVLVDDLVKSMQRGITYVVNKPHSDYNLHIVTSLIKHLNNFNPMSEDKDVIRKRALWFASLIVCKQVRSSLEVKPKDKFENNMVHYSNELSIEEKEDPRAEADIFDKLFFEDVTKYVGRKQGEDSLKLLDLLYLGYTNMEISKLTGQSVRTIDRKIQKLFKIVLDYLNKKEVTYK